MFFGGTIEASNISNISTRLAKKNIDMIAANCLRQQGAGFGVDTNVVTIITKEETKQLPLMGKDQVAAQLLDEIQQHRQA